MRRLPVLAVVVLALVAACGGDDSESSETTSVPTTARPTAEADKARAGRIVLTAADLPGYAEDPSSEEDGAEVDQAFAACVKDDPVLTAEEGTDPRTVDGSDFEKGDGELSVGSSATIAETEDQARTAIAELRQETVLDCLGTSFREGLAESVGSDATVRSVSVDDLPVAAAGDESAGLRLRASVGVGGQTVRVTSDVTAFRRERAVAFLVTTGVDSPFPDAERTALAAKMAGRMAA